MKAALRASLTDSNWLDKLPWVILGLRTAPKEDLRSSSAELVFGQPLRVPGDFLPKSMEPWSASAQRASQLDGARNFASAPTARHGVPASRVPPELQSAGYVFIRHDGHRAPLRPPYDGPLRVIEAGAKNFMVDMGGKPECVSVDRLKPAHLDLELPPDLALPPRRGRPPVLPPLPRRGHSPLQPLQAPTACGPPVVAAPRHAQRGDVMDDVTPPPAPPDFAYSRGGRAIRPPRLWDFEY